MFGTLPPQQFVEQLRAGLSNRPTVAGQDRRPRTSLRQSHAACVRPAADRAGCCLRRPRSARGRRSAWARELSGSPTTAEAARWCRRTPRARLCRSGTSESNAPGASSARGAPAARASAACAHAPAPAPAHANPRSSAANCAKAMDSSSAVAVGSQQHRASAPSSPHQSPGSSSMVGRGDGCTVARERADVGGQQRQPHGHDQLLARGLDAGQGSASPVAKRRVATTPPLSGESRPPDRSGAGRSWHTALTVVASPGVDRSRAPGACTGWARRRRRGRPTRRGR